MGSNAQYTVILLVVLLFSMSIHEMMHAFAADWLGDDTARLQGRLTLNPLAHIDPVLTVLVPLVLLLEHLPPFGAARPVQVNFNRLRYGDFGGAIVGVVGPLTNLLIALVASLFFTHFNLAYGSLAYQVIGMAVLINLSFFLFNIIPMPPLDGSRLLYAFAPAPVQELMASVERAGLMSLVIFVLLFWTVLSGPFSNLITDLMKHLAPGFTSFLGI
ncbi:MAG TPA: site-2 protease family protein [Candidatus Saccharimonadales bacterium]|nr:site-2 protease family protein [Candidatus Saccharimonadales bacterium]